MISILIICLALLAGNLRFAGCQQTNYSCAVKLSQANTAEKLSQLRAQMRSLSLYAYVIFSEEEHHSEYVEQYDTRRAWITGFLGSAGSVVVTLDQAALWIDGRYWAQAENELDCANWFLMRQGEPGVPTLDDWVTSKLNPTSSYNKVGVAAQFTSSNFWSSMESTITSGGMPLVEVAELIDEIRTTDRSMASNNPVFVHEIMFAGISWEKKVEIIAGLINAESSDGFLVIAPDEVAWLFNIRGSDIPYNPFFTV
jgi:Xaa-Pro aminopeptidase